MSLFGKNCPDFRGVSGPLSLWSLRKCWQACVTLERLVMVLVTGRDVSEI